MKNSNDLDLNRTRTASDYGSEMTIEELRADLRAMSVDPDRAIARIRRTLSFYLEAKPGAPDIILRDD